MLVVVDQPASIGALPLAVARDMGCPVAYLPGLTMRRIADLYPGEAKTDARDAFIIADAARAMPHTPRQAPPGHAAAAKGTEDGGAAGRGDLRRPGRADRESRGPRRPR
ncbi:hypothetical protein GCM10023097_18370 [Streptomyces collinus]